MVLGSLFVFAGRRIGVESLLLRLLGENGAFRTVCVTLNGQQKCGAMLRADYDAV